MINVNFAPNENWHDARTAFCRIFLPNSWYDTTHVEETKNQLASLVNSKPESIFLLLSARSALFGVLQSLNLPKESEVIVQGFTCEAVVLPIIQLSLNLIYADIESTSFSLDYDDFLKKVSSKTKVVILQHSFGMIPQNRSKILAFAQSKDLLVIEDCAHGFYPHFSQNDEYKTIKIFSFGRSKLFSSVHGGAIDIPNDELAIKFTTFYQKLDFPDKDFVLKVLLYKILTPFIKSARPQILGKILFTFFSFIFTREISGKEKQSEYDPWLEKKLPGVLVDFLLPQFSQATQLITDRSNRAKQYADALDHTFEKNNLPLLRAPFLVENRSEILKRCANKNIFLGTWYEQPVAPNEIDLRTVKYIPGSCPKAEVICEKILNVPLRISHTEAEHIIHILQESTEA